MTDEGLDECAFEHWQQHRGQYGFIKLTDSIMPYTEGFKDGFKAAIDFSKSKHKTKKKPVCPKCRHYKDPHVYITDTNGYKRIIQCKEPSEHCKKCIDTGYSLWEKEDD